jgi:hypothetical protein
MEQLRQGRTSFVIAHRLSKIRDADTIISWTQAASSSKASTPSCSRAAGSTPRSTTASSPRCTLSLQPPDPTEPPPRLASSKIHRRDRLGGLLHEYYRAAA